MMRRSLVIARTAGACASALVFTATMLHAQAPPRPGHAVRCDAVLTSAEATAIAGDGYEGPVVNEPRPGVTDCQWQGTDTNFGFTFASLSALKADEVTAEKEFELNVQAVEDGSRKRELLAGIGKRAAIVTLEGDAFLVAVQRPDGVARMILYKVPRETAIALARGIATP